MRKYKKIFIGLILGLMCAILPFVGVAKVKAAINSVSDLKNTSWLLNENITFPNSEIYLLTTESTTSTVATYQYNESNIANFKVSTTIVNDIEQNRVLYISTTGITYWGVLVGTATVTRTIYSNGGWLENYGVSPRRLTFNDFEFTQSGDFLGWLQANATQENAEPTPRTIPFRISLITDLFDNTLGYVNSNVIDLPVYDDTVSFTVSFQNNQMITGQISHPEADAVEELIFSNGERVFYTIYYNDTNIDFKLYFYGEQLYLYEAVMYNTEVLDSSGNYQATVATYSEGISEQEMETLKNSGIYEASFEITIPQENELVTDAQLMLEMGISSNAEPPEMENISNIMTGIFTLVSSFLSIQLGFITLGQIIGLILAIGVVFFIFYVWNGGRNGN